MAKIIEVKLPEEYKNKNKYEIFTHLEQVATLAHNQKQKIEDLNAEIKLRDSQLQKQRADILKLKSMVGHKNIEIQTLKLESDVMDIEAQVIEDEREKNKVPNFLPPSVQFEKVKVEKKYWSIAGKTEDIKVSNNVFFNEDKGKIIIGMSIKAGKPKKPLKETCKNLIENSMARSFYLPSQKIVPSSPNKSLLNLLYRGGTYENYNEELEKVANNIVYVSSITSEVLRDLDKGGYDYFNMTCYKLSSDEDIIFRKWSFASNK